MVHLPTSSEPTRSTGKLVSLVLALMLALTAFVPALGSVGVRSALAQATTEDKTATVAPADALIYASINLDTKSDQFTLAKDLIKRAGLAEEVDTATSSTSAKDQAAIDAVTGGYAAFVLTKLPAEYTNSLASLPTEIEQAASSPSDLAGNGVPSGFAVILQPSDPDAAEKSLMDEVTNTDAGQKVETETYEGVEITSIPAQSKDDAGTAIARVGDFIVIATIPDDIHPIIDAESGKTANLADSDTYSELKSSLNAEWLAFGLVNGPRMLADIEAASPTAASEIPAGTKAQLQSTSGFVFWADQPGFRMDTIAIASTDAPAAVATPSVTGDLASKVPADTLIFANGMNINQYGVLDAIGLIFASALVGTGSSTTTPVATPASLVEQQAAIYAEAASVLGFNLKTDFIDQLDGEYGFALSATDLTSDSPKIDAIFVTDTVNAQKVTDTASKISFILAAAIDGDMLSSREVDGDTVTTINAGDASFPLKIEYGVVGGQLLIGVNDGIDNYVNGPAKPLATSPLYKDTLAQLPGDPTGITFVNFEQITPLIAEAEAAYSGSMSSTDASPDCAKFSSQAEAQAAYDEDSFTNFDLDQNFNGKACEDFFATATPEASPAAAPLSGLRSVGMVTYEKDGHQASSMIILIADN
ncbi:MAG: DUF3352 domain-containing protein [Thermomicrobiales bacterium]